MRTSIEEATPSPWPCPTPTEASQSSRWSSPASWRGWRRRTEQSRILSEISGNQIGLTLVLLNIWKIYIDCKNFILFSATYETSIIKNWDSKHISFELLPGSPNWAMPWLVPPGWGLPPPPMATQVLGPSPQGLPRLPRTGQSGLGTGQSGSRAWKDRHTGKNGFVFKWGQVRPLIAR